MSANIMDSAGRKSVSNPNEFDSSTRFLCMDESVENILSECSKSVREGGRGLENMSMARPSGRNTVISSRGAPR